MASRLLMRTLNLYSELDTDLSIELCDIRVYNCAIQNLSETLNSNIFEYLT